MQVDDVHDCLDGHDVRVFQQGQKAATVKQNERQSFKEESGERVERRRSEDLEQPKRKRAKAISGAGSSEYSRLPPLHTISQAEAKRYTLPGGFLWQDRATTGWQAHHPPFSRIGRSIGRHGAAVVPHVLVGAPLFG